MNYIIRKGNGETQEAIRTIDLTDVVTGTVHSYVNKNGSYRNDTSEAVLGTKLNYIDYDRDTNAIVVKASEVVNNPQTAFSLKKPDGTAVSITDVSNVGTNYTLSLGESLIKMRGTYILTYDGVEYSITIAGDNTGDNNTGDSNTGDNNTGDNNTGDNNTGNNNTGHNNTGNNNGNLDGNNGENSENSPVTGDESHIYIWLLMMIVGALGIVVTRKKKFIAMEEE